MRQLRCSYQNCHAGIVVLTLRCMNNSITSHEYREYPDQCPEAEDESMRIRTKQHIASLNQSR